MSITVTSANSNGKSINTLAIAKKLSSTGGIRTLSWSLHPNGDEK